MEPNYPNSTAAAVVALKVWSGMKCVKQYLSPLLERT